MSILVQIMFFLPNLMIPNLFLPNSVKCHFCLINFTLGDTQSHAEN